MVNCAQCNSNFKNPWNLKRHVVKKHPGRVSELVPQVYKSKVECVFSCNICGKNFNSERNLKYHKKIHRIKQENNLNSNKHKCPLCDYCDISKKQLLIHFQEVHNIEIVSECRNFSTKNEFYEWKRQLEVESNCTFVVLFSKSVSDKSYRHFACHRSGQFISKAKGIRHAKTQGSNKINAFCPANLKLLEDKQGKCHVNFISTHVGHINDLAHTCLTTEERKNIARKIESKMPFDDILDEIRSSVSDDDVKRIHLVTRKDLYNIEREYNLSSSSVRRSNNAGSIEAWVNEMRKTTDCVLYYKPQDTFDMEHNELNSHDFLLIIMNEAQCDILKKYGTDCICVDGMHGLSSCNFELITLMVLDDTQQSFPCAFLISNRTDHKVLKMFFSCIRERAGCMKSKTFMSDMNDSFYNAWLPIMGETKYRLYCSWDVDNDWRKNLGKIKSKEKQVSIYKQLRTILVERDEKSFTKMLEQVHKQLFQDPETIEFANYFKNDYMTKCQNWAVCFRSIEIGIDTNTHLESMHKILKHICSKEKTVKRLDKAVSSLMKFVRQKLFDRLLEMTKGNISSKLQDIYSRHKKSLTLHNRPIVQKEGGWEIQSSSNNYSESYSLQENHEFDDCHCQLVCTDCKVCIHRYTCSCIDSSIRWNMCKHIHLLCQSRKDLMTAPNVNQDEAAGQVHINLNESCIEKIALSFEERKSEVGQKLNQMSNILDSIQTSSELHEFEKIIDRFSATWEGVKLNK